jgi:D-xylose transport system permease protein
MSITKAPPQEPARLGGARRSRLRSLLRATEIDARMLGMIVALLIIWIAFHRLSGGTFLTARNLWNLSVQTTSVAIMATGMVLVIVSRNIDLSVGSMVGLIGMMMAIVQVEILPDLFGGFGHPLIWVIAVLVGMALGALLGAFQGFIIAYVGVPSFIVTLGGLLVWRGVAWRLTKGRTIAPMDSTYQLLGGGSRGSIGELGSWIIAALACAGIVYLLVRARRQRIKYKFHVRPPLVDAALGVIGCAVVLGAVQVLNSYYLPQNVARQVAQERGIDPTGPLQIPLGIAYPVLIAIGVTLVMTYIATQRRFGRYVYSIGGNPEAANLGGINTRMTVVKTYMLMGVLVAISAAVLTARLNAATSGLGTLSELYVIAAAVIGGTSLAGGVGTIPGAVLGALVTQSLQSGMVLLRVDAPVQDIVVGVVLVAAVTTDVLYRRRAAR